MADKLNSNFIVELAKLCLVSKDTADVVSKHLSYSFLKSQEHKEVFKYIFDYYSSSTKTPTLGTMSQHLPQTPEMVNVITQIRQASVYDNKDEILASFEQFIKKGRFQKLHEDVKELYNKQEHDRAMLLMEKESTAINNFSLVSQVHSRLFADFDKRQLVRKGRDFTSIKIPTGIPAFDYHTFGGPELKTSLLGVARSGVGKSTLLRWLGFNAAFRGYNVVHFQAEGAKDEVQDAYDAMWTGVNVMDIKKGDLTGKDIAAITKARQSFLAQCGEIYIIAFEQFDTASIAQARQQLIELKKVVDIHVGLFDYLDLFDPGDGKRYSTNAEGERSRKAAVAKKIVNIGTELNMLTATMTQASDIARKDWNDPNFFITRNDISNLKATVDPFAYVLTLNQTEDENDKDIIRIHEEKIRHYKVKSWESTYHVAQNREVGRFVDLGETNVRFWDPVKKQVIKNAPKVK